MKTGGTLNFLKRAGAILMLLAIFASSCNKYADDFKQLNTKLDALALTVNGVTQLQSDITLLKGSIATLQAAITALPNPTTSIATLTTNLATANTNIGLIQTALATLATAVSTKASSVEVANVTTAIKAELTLQLVTVNANIAKANTALAAAVLANDAQTATIQKAILDNNTALAAAIKLQTDALAASITTLSGTETASNASLTAAVVALQTLVTGQKAILDQLLAASNMYNGDVTITTVPEMRFYYGKLQQLGIVNGNLTINTTNLTDKLDTVNMITSKIQSVIGTQSDVKNKVTVTSVASTIVLDLSNLVNVTGDYKVTGVDISDNKLSTVGGNVLVSYDGKYDFPNLANVGGNLTLTMIPYVSGTTVGTTSINLPIVAVVGNVFDSSLGAAGVLNYPDATSIVMSGGVSSLTAKIATTITLGSGSFASGLMISAVKCTALSIAKATSAAGAVAITTAAGCTVDMSSLATADGGLTFTGPTTLSFPALASGALTSSTATTVKLAVHEWAIPATLAAVTDLTLGKVAAPVAAANYPTLKALSVTGKGTTKIALAGWDELTGSVTTTASNTVLASVNLGGNLRSAVIQNNVKLTSLTVGGIVNSLTIDTNKLLVGVTLTNTHFEGGPGSNLTVINNVALTGLTSSTDKAKSITIKGNTAMTYLNLASYHAILEPTSSVYIEIGGNKLSGTYTAPTAATATTTLIEATIASADLLTIKDYIRLLNVPANAIILTVTADLYDCIPASSGAQSLVSQMIDGVPSYSNAFGTSKVDTTPGINSAAEFTMVW